MLFKNDGIISLKSNHPYYSQAQHQMFVAGATDFDFVFFLSKTPALLAFYMTGILWRKDYQN